ncbi:MAG: hypothetical protein GEV28_31590 [Actinophytocola sp.]|uniref:hypothetical protein n=1 Tax=Actinophytocola sp. TaxID=1872138 RepID=UPI0013252930|nr:hypothetical protein [Actinophytocola sp.]MPZ84684.1 hypothetical protein [Actinophytocola sp.]
MASKQAQAVREMYLSWAAAGGEESDDEAWGDLTAEPRGVDYLETDAGGVPAMMAGRAPEADDAIRRLAEWVRPRLGLT